MIGPPASEQQINKSGIGDMLGKSYGNQSDILQEARRLAQEAGFAVVTRNSSKSTLYLMCACGGQPRRKKPPNSDASKENGVTGESDSGKNTMRKRVSIRCGCPFLLGANLRRDGLWHVSKVDDEHNHTLVSHPYIFQLHKTQNGLNSPSNSSIGPQISPKKSSPVEAPSLVMDVYLPDSPSPFIPEIETLPVDHLNNHPVDQNHISLGFAQQSKVSKDLLKDVWSYIGSIGSNSNASEKDSVLKKLRSVIDHNRSSREQAPKTHLMQSISIPPSLPPPGPPIGPTNEFKLDLPISFDSISGQTFVPPLASINMPAHSVPTPQAVLQPTTTSMETHFFRSLGLDPTYGQCISQFNPSHSKNSGFQALAYAVYKDETKFRDIKCKMSGVLSQNSHIYQQLYWCDMPKLLVTLQTDEAFYPHDCPQLAANALERPVACFPFNFPPILFLPLNPPSSSHADIFPIFLGQSSSGSWVLLEVPRSAPFHWPPICHLHQEVCTSLGIDSHVGDTWRSLTTTR